jgi:hypothetical protein
VPKNINLEITTLVTTKANMYIASGNTLEAQLLGILGVAGILGSLSSLQLQLYALLDFPRVKYTKKLSRQM